MSITEFVESPGEYKLRRCGHDNYEYCDGICSKCPKSAQSEYTTTTNGVMSQTPYTTNTSGGTKYDR